MFCTQPSVFVSGTPAGIVLKFTAVTHLESSMNWLDLVLNFQAWHFLSKRTKVSFTLSTSCSAASLLRPTFSSAADKTSRSSAVRFSAGDCYFCILTRCWLYGSSELPRWARTQKIKIFEKKKSLVWLWILLQFKSQSDSFICLHCTLNRSPSRTSSLFLYRNTKLIKVKHSEIHKVFLKSVVWRIVSYKGFCRLFAMYFAMLLCCQWYAFIPPGSCFVRDIQKKPTTLIFNFFYIF